MKKSKSSQGDRQRSNARVYRWDSVDYQKRSLRAILKKYGALEPRQAGQKINGRVLESEGLSGLLAKHGTVHNLLRMYFGDRFKPWMLKKIPVDVWGTIENPNQETIREAIDDLLARESLKLEDLSNRILADGGLNSLAVTFDYSIGKIGDAYLGRKRNPWEYSKAPKGFWRSKENVATAIRWLTEEKLKIHPTKLPNTIRQDLFVENGLAGMTACWPFANIPEAVIYTYPKLGFSKKDFRFPSRNSFLGMALEKVIHEILKGGLKLDYKANMAVEGCDHAIKCKPDITELYLKGYFSQSELGEIKLRTSTLERSESKRYLDHCKNLFVIYLLGSPFKIERVRFVHVNTLLKLVPSQIKSKSRWNSEIKEITSGSMPKRLEYLLPKSARGVFSIEFCKLIKLENCTVSKKYGAIGEVEQIGFCTKHLSQYRNGMIDFKGKPLREIDRRTSFRPEQLLFIESNYETMTNKQLALAIYGESSKKAQSAISAKIASMGLQRSIESQAATIGRLVGWNSKNRKILGDNFRTKSNGELCRIFGIANTKENRAYVSGALARFGFVRSANEQRMIKGSKVNWTSENLKKLQRLCKTHTVPQICLEFGLKNNASSIKYLHQVIYRKKSRSK